MRDGIPSSIPQAQNHLPLAIKINRNYKGMHKRKYGKRFKLLKF